MHKNYYGWLKFPISFLIGVVCSISSSWAFQPPSSYSFPIQNYDQEITHWLNVNNLSQSLLITNSVQKTQFENFYDHYIGSASSWDQDYIIKITSGDVETAQLQVFDDYDNSKQVIEGNKGRSQCSASPYSNNWLAAIKNVANLSQFAGRSYDPNRLGIAVNNLNARALPTNDRYFHDCDLPGEGDSFDYLQVSALWAGTPVYILGETQDKKWYLISSSTDFIAWVPSDGIAKVNPDFIATWKKAASNQLVAINSSINTKLLSIKDEVSNTKRFSGYIGAVFPLSKEDEGGYHILIPMMGADHQAQIQQAFLQKEDAVLMPLTPTISNFISVINNLKGRAYGWGNLNIIDPTEFNYDCSSELKSLYTPFGIWLPRHSSKQVNPDKVLGIVGSVFDFSNEKSPNERISKLTQIDQYGNDHRFTTIVYIGGHVFMYLGSYQAPSIATIGGPVALTYQNIWGLRPVAGEIEGKPLPEGRYVIGKSVLFPLLAQYPERYPYPIPRELVPLVSKPYFQVAHLDELPLQPLELWSQFIKFNSTMDIKELYTLMLVGE